MKTHMSSAIDNELLCGRKRKDNTITVPNPNGADGVTCKDCRAIIESADLRKKLGITGNHGLGR